MSKLACQTAMLGLLAIGGCFSYAEDPTLELGVDVDGAYQKLMPGDSLDIGPAPSGGYWSTPLVRIDGLECGSSWQETWSEQTNCSVNASLTTLRGLLVGQGDSSSPGMPSELVGGPPETIYAPILIDALDVDALYGQEALLELSLQRGDLQTEVVVLDVTLASGSISFAPGNGT